MSYRKLRKLARGLGFVGYTCFLVGLWPLAFLFGDRLRKFIRHAWSRGSCRILGVRVTSSGAPFTACPTMIVANHVSYLDIIVLGSFTDATFIAKSEIDGWPFFGFIARLVGTMFVRRHWRQALIQRDAIAARMRGDESFVLFAEGTSTNGLALRPFKTSLLSVVEPWVMDRPVAAQAATLSYLRLADGTPFDLGNCDRFAWYADMPFMPHLLDLLEEDGVEVAVTFHEPVLSWSVEGRKSLAPALRQEIAAHLLASRQDVLGDSRGPGLALEEGLLIGE